MSEKEWIFTEEQRDAVCKGQICPRCLSTNIKFVEFHFDLVNQNSSYDCLDCNEQWEGY